MLAPELTNTEYKKDQIAFSPSRIFISSTSPRRQLFVIQMFGGRIDCVPFNDVGKEPAMADVLHVARFKVDTLLTRLSGMEQLGQNKDAIIVSADTRTIIPEINSAGKLILTSKGKPSSLEDIRSNFKNMLAVAEQTKDDPFYSVQSGSVCRRVRGNEVPIEAETSGQFVLDASGLYYLSTNEGIAQYHKAFLAFYSSPPYSTHGMKPVVPTDLSGGMSLPVLTWLGVITRINNQESTSPYFREEFRNAVHTVAVGIPPSLFRPYNARAEMLYQNWPWLNEVVDHALLTQPLYE